MSIKKLLLPLPWCQSGQWLSWSFLYTTFCVDVSRQRSEMISSIHGTSLVIFGELPSNPWMILSAILTDRNAHALVPSLLTTLACSVDSNWFLSEHCSLKATRRLFSLVAVLWVTFNLNLSQFLETLYSPLKIFSTAKMESLFSSLRWVQVCTLQGWTTHVLDVCCILHLSKDACCHAKDCRQT